MKFIACFFLFSACALVSLAANAQSTLAPSRASDLITLALPLSDPNKCSDSFSPGPWGRVDMLQGPDGSVVPSYSIPPGKVLVVTSLRISAIQPGVDDLPYGEESFGLSGGDFVFIVNPVTEKSSLLTWGLIPIRVNQSLGVQVYETTFPSGLAVKSGSVICARSDAIVIVHGFLAPDK